MMATPSKDDSGCVFFIGAALACWGAYLAWGPIPAGVCLMIFGLALAVLAIF